MITSKGNSITLFIADDHPMAREGLKRILAKARDITVVGEGENGEDIKKLIPELQPDILLLDLKMPGTSAASIEKWVRMHFPNTNTLVLTAHDRDYYLAEMMEAGVSGYFSKSERAETLIDAIRRAANKENLFTREQLLRVEMWREVAGDKWEDLTDREREVFSFLKKGLDNRTIAKQLNISIKTVAFHVSAILNKLGGKSRHEIIAWYHNFFSEDSE